MPKTEQVQNIFTTISPYYDRMNDLMTFGFHRFWKKKVIKLCQLEKNKRLLDLCTGTGDLALLAAEKIGKNGEVIGIDFCAPMISIARQKAQAKGLNQLSFVQGDIQSLPYPDESFPCTTIAFGLRNTNDPQMALAEMYRVLKKEGIWVCLEATEVQFGFIKYLSRFYTEILIPQMAKLLGKDVKAYEYLPDSVKRFWNREEMLANLKKIGFRESRCITFLWGAATIYYAKK